MSSRLIFGHAHVNETFKKKRKADCGMVKMESSLKILLFFN